MPIKHVHDVDGHRAHALPRKACHPRGESGRVAERREHEDLGELARGEPSTAAGVLAVGVGDAERAGLRVGQVGDLRRGPAPSLGRRVVLSGGCGRGSGGRAARTRSAGSGRRRYRRSRSR